MKKLIYTLTGIVSTTVLWAQSYTFSTGNRLYNEITQAQWSDTTFVTYLKFKPMYPMSLFGQKLHDSMYVGTQTGYVVTSDANDGFAMDPMMGTRFRKINGKSSLKVQTMVNAIETVMVMQWKDVGFFGHADSEYMNFQLWYSFTTGKISYHYGPSFYVLTTNDSAFMDPANTGPEILLVRLTPDFNGFKEFHSVSGDKNNPVFLNTYGRFSGLPNPNQEFVFTPGVFNAVTKNNWSVPSILLYPNPTTSGQVFIEAPESIRLVTVTNLLGQEVSLSEMHIMSNRAELILPEQKQPLWIKITLSNGLTSIKQLHVH